MYNNINEEIFDSLLKIAFYEHAKNEFDSLPSKDELDTLYPLTKKELRFAKKKDKELKYKKPLYIVYLRRAAIALPVILALAFCLALLNSDIRMILKKEFFDQFNITEKNTVTDTTIEIIEKNGNLYYTIDGIPQLYGLYESEGEYYYAHSDGALARDGVAWVSNTNGLIDYKGYYGFDTEGRLIKTGFVKAPTGHIYYYDNAVLSRGLTKIGDNYYFFNESSGGMYRDIYAWVGSDNTCGYKEGYYYFLSDGKMFIPSPDAKGEIISENGNFYYTVDSIKLTNGIYELDGEYYFAKSDSSLYANSTVWIPHSAALEFGGQGGYYTFDSQARLVQTGFVNTPDGYTYYRSNNLLAKGTVKIGEDYYFFNKASGSMYKDANMWVGADNIYGIDYGYYYFNAEGQME